MVSGSNERRERWVLVCERTASRSAIDWNVAAQRLRRFREPVAVTGSDLAHRLQVSNR